MFCGAAGGNIAAGLLKNINLGLLGNSIAGIIGGGLGSWVSGLLGAGGAMAGLDTASVIAQIVSGGLGGAVLMAFFGAIKSMIAK